MPEVTYVKASGEAVTVAVDEGVSVMQGALSNMIDGIDAECGGACSCGTCHCYVDEQWFPVLGAPSDHEMDMLDCVANPRPNSRLSCQILLKPELDGLVVRLPESQRI